METLKACTDLGNAERFIGQHKNGLRYCPQLKQWLSIPMSIKCVDAFLNYTNLQKPKILLITNGNKWPKSL
jgi:hypothetical protein